ncbi:MAG: ECF transporter S component [Eubacteriales bacterium]
MNRKTQNLVLAAFFLALGMILPAAIGSVSPTIGAIISPLHIPVLLCGFICGKRYGFMVGFLSPLIKIAVYGVPPLFIAIPMCVELAGYGFFTGFMSEKIGQSAKNIYISLITAMLSGRLAYGITTYFVTTFALLGSGGGEYTIAAFLTSGAMLGGIPGIISHIIIVPSVLFAVNHAKVLYISRTTAS